MKQLEENLSQALAEIDELKGTAASSGKQVQIPNPQGDNHVGFVDQRLHDGLLDLPPLQETLPFVEKYLATLNSILPLFHPGRLLHSLKSWYDAPPGQRDCATWAAINVVLALAHRQVPPDQANKTTAYFLHKAQSVLTEVIMGKADIINVQLLLGLVMLFQGTRNLKPAAMLIAVALRLAHELGLHTRKGSSENFNQSTTLELDRVFWIAYILDRDISMRTGQPPVQLETDIDLELPSANPKDGAGLVFAADSSSSFNFFRARVELARIQGKVYELMLSVPAKRLDAYQRGGSMAQLHYMLDVWASQIPLQFQPQNLLTTCEPDLVRNLGILHATHLSCRTQKRMVEPIVLPQGWQVFVNESREYMRLFMGVERKDTAFVCEPYPFISPTRPELSAAGKNIVITGGGTGIGKAIGIAFAQAGAKSIAIVGRRLDRLATAVDEIKQAASSTTHVLCEAGDVTDLVSIKSALAKIVSQLDGGEGKIDIFAANAGVLPEEAPVFGYSEAELRKSFEVNVMGTFNSLQAFLPLASPNAKLFNTGSGIGHWAPLPEVPGVFGYAATKAAALKIVDYFAAENPGIHVVSIMPGIIATEINPRITVGADTVELPAHFLVWLASEEATFLKGKFVWANWDAQELIARADEIQGSMLLRVSLNGVDI
ncbi:hypothetical protein PISL3812_02458 [Talaromyces islandicus]|uniref:Xylanolytic transcriptional activator regulatory domain-containing protein n=1 Tax=Talaromyces islandicus TaxID=28573 RepID=A0A0U1LS72_TALIS|nr:hypothetical protein PISL3812_02458 [Talaromyces islandicus]